MKVLEKMMVFDVAEHQRRKTNAHNNLVENMQKSMRKPIPKRRQNVVKRDRGPPPPISIIYQITPYRYKYGEVDFHRQSSNIHRFWRITSFEKKELQKCRQEPAKVTKSRLTVSKSQAKGRQSKLKESQREAKGSQREPKENERDRKVS